MNEIFINSKIYILKSLLFIKPSPMNFFEAYRLKLYQNNFILRVFNVQ